jgi:hypothetical protein
VIAVECSGGLVGRLFVGTPGAERVLYALDELIVGEGLAKDRYGIASRARCLARSSA